MAETLISKYFLAIFLYLIAIAHIIGGLNDWYLTVWWYDILIHFLGGAWLALLFSIYFPKHRSNFFVVLGFVFFIGIGWEVYEFLIEFIFVAKGQMSLIQMTLKDTLGDLISNFFGGATIFFIYKNL